MQRMARNPAAAHGAGVSPRAARPRWAARRRFSTVPPVASALDDDNAGHRQQREGAADDALLALLVRQASVRPLALVPAAAAAAAAASHDHQRAPAPLPPQQLPALLLPRLRPQRLPWGPMYAQLAAWRAAHLTAHVPHHCFDAPDLGAWVRHLRKERKEGRLEQWKVDRLDALGFQWELAQGEARWHALFHQLRRFKAVHGHTALGAGFRSCADRDWVLAARWLRRQAHLLATEQLPARHRAMLAALGVTLSVPRELVASHARLQGMNRHERKLERRRQRQRAAGLQQARARRLAAAQAQAEGEAAALAAQDRQRRALRQRLVEEEGGGVWPAAAMAAAAAEQADASRAAPAAAPPAPGAAPPLAAAPAAGQAPPSITVEAAEQRQPSQPPGQAAQHDAADQGSPVHVPQHPAEMRGPLGAGASPVAAATVASSGQAAAGGDAAAGRPGRVRAYERNAGGIARRRHIARRPLQPDAADTGADAALQ